MKAEIIKRMETALIDAGSARYLWPEPWPQDGPICGKVNSKNSFGGYVGYRRFMAKKDAVGLTLMIEGPDSQVENSLIDMACKK
ncbi:hypothetical protein [Sphingobium yanoikuyae]|uniref:hypothetical protein n=1 Tax=Sphingobium yanoikuyae TaxID=13690 RepID=UPI00345EF8BB